MKSLFKERGVTLIALVITIVILIILAGVTINVLLGENGLIAKAKEAKELQDEATKNETKSIEQMIADMEEILTGEKQAGPINDKTSGVLEGEGTSEKPYLIEGIEDLVAFSNIVNTGENLGVTYENSTYSGEYVKLVQTLDFNSNNSYNDPNSTMFGDLNKDGIVEGIKEELTKQTAMGFTPIGYKPTQIVTSQTEGTMAGYFDGTFDGNNCEIKNLYINRTDETTTELNKNIEEPDTSVYPFTIIEYYSGLFGLCFSNSSIENLGVSGNINYKDDNRENIGGIVGNCFGSIKNCYNKCNITVKNITEYGTVGGIAGNFAYVTIENCYNIGKIAVIDSNNTRIGGVTGNLGYANMTNCYNKGEITSTGKATYARVGGIAGSGIVEGSNNITNCYNEGKVAGQAENARIGGIVGESEGINVINCSNKGEIAGTGTTYAIVGGIVGYGYNNFSIENCYNIEKVTGKANNARVGGILGANYYEGTITITIKNSYNKGEITGTGITYASVGGIVGYGYNNFSIENCYNIEKVTGKANDVRAGGILGDNYYEGTITITIKNSYNKGEIAGTGTTYACVGGIAGYGIAEGSNNITNCYNEGKVAGQAENARIGGIVGESKGINVINCSNKGEITGTGITYASVGGIVGYGYNNFSIENCYNSEKVTGKANDVRAGGILGDNNYEGTVTMSIKNSYNKGEITGIGTSKTWVGGIVGYPYSINISNCYNVANIQGSATKKYVGGIIGYNKSSTKADCYFLKGKGGDDTSSEAKDSITPSELLEWLNTNRGENAEWTIVQNQNDGYPIFK